MIKYFGLLVACLWLQAATAQHSKWQYQLDLSPGTIHVTLDITDNKADTILFKMPVWVPGYYQLMPFPEKVSQFNAGSLEWVKKTANGWWVKTAHNPHVVLQYDIKADQDFVAACFVNDQHALLNLEAVCMYSKVDQPVSIKIHTPAGWTVATGMDKKGDAFQAADFDILYDSPVIAGKLDSLPPFTVKGIPHYFVGYDMVPFDATVFMNNLKKMVETASGIIGDIPYHHYTFLGIGNGRGGIEHLNSTLVSFTGNGLNTTKGQETYYSFLAHEYFHHYNVKRIRPVELGPFDYDHGNKTKMLWVAEGLTVYYEYIIIRHAGIISDTTMRALLRSSLMAYETQTGKNYQSLTQASWETWEDGPFGRKNDTLVKTISYYDKGPLIGFLLDLQIRHVTGNKKSLNDVMRKLYYKYYKQLGRGYTEKEFQQVCEQVAGIPLKEIFEYASTTKPVDYNKYFAYAGLTLVPGTYEIVSLPAPDKLQATIYNSIF